MKKRRSLQPDPCVYSEPVSVLPEIKSLKFGEYFNFRLRTPLKFCPAMPQSTKRHGSLADHKFTNLRFGPRFFIESTWCQYHKSFSYVTRDAAEIF